MPLSGARRARAEPQRGSRLALLVVASLVAGLFAEWALREWFPEIGKLRSLVVSTNDERGFAPRADVEIPFAGVFSKLSQPVVWKMNAEGMRQTGEVGFPSARLRVATYGDSETFGWSVASERTFQRRMQAIDPRVEVLNFGVPGYNVTNVRAYLEQTVPRFQPDFVIYLVNKNDFNEPVRFSPLSYSHLLLHLRFLWHFTIGKQLRLWVRDAPERLETFAREVERMTRFLETRQTPFVMGFLKWQNHEFVREHAESETFHRDLVDVKAVLAGELKEDLHYTGSAHERMAVLFCQVISGERAGACIPSGWQRGALVGRTSAGAATPGR